MRASARPGRLPPAPWGRRRHGGNFPHSARYRAPPAPLGPSDAPDQYGKAQCGRGLESRKFFRLLWWCIPARPGDTWMKLHVERKVVLNLAETAKYFGVSKTT